MDMDANPTIKPILDMSDILSKSKAISGLLNGNTVELSAKANSLKHKMMEYRQNGSTDDVVSAIDRLRKDMRNVGNTSYTINGITYDDGSNISDAVESIVRAARIGRRS